MGQGAVLIKTSPKGFWASKCDVGNWIIQNLGNFWEFVAMFGEFFGNFWEFRREFFGFLHFQTQLIVDIVKSQLIFYSLKVSS